MITNVDRWLQERGIPYDWAKRLAEDVARDYPKLTAALKEYRDVEGELEFAQFAYEFKQKTIKHLTRFAEPAAKE